MQIGPGAWVRMAASCSRLPAPGPSRSMLAVDAGGGDLLYFSLTGGGDPPAGPCPRPPPLLQPLLAGGGRALSLAVCAPGEQRVPAARLHAELRRALAGDGGGSRRVLDLLAFRPADLAGSLRRGFLLLEPRGAPAAGQRGLPRLLAPHLPRLRVCAYELDSRGRVWQCPWEPGRARRVVEAAAPGPEVHPAVPSLRRAALFGCWQEAQRVLQECIPFIPEVKEVLEVWEKCPKYPQKGNFPVIVVEGLDATGKTTLTQSLKDSLRAILLKSPPACISQWRKIFDDEPALIRRAFYALGNYIVASEIAMESTKSPVIVDRYWHSTAAYALATEVSGGLHNLPGHHHEVYQWPEDLLKPDLVVLLTLSPEERAHRLQGRGTEKTKEEVELESNILFRKKVEELYKRMENPGCIAVDASPSREEVIRNVLHLIKNHCLI
ncbi:UMP-CMP kinase 2, mitochondrial [Rhinatrema bivittatum]|uniref:UMP-CMP kinase 2, mitochondrial n=1 Tax=Rhinatrema bivittatum TaxID=194408 RepID=UPI00112D329D|nr:UMP-CMP kinase 2, mitochondrial [Rhinatrema bivittatum]